MNSFRLAFMALRQALHQAEARLDLLHAGAAFFAALALLGAGLAAGLAFVGGWQGAGFLLLCTAGPPIALRFRRRLRSREEDAVLLDRRFALGELLVTALEVDRRPQPRSVEQALLEQAAGTARQLQRSPLLAKEVRRSAELVAALALLAAGTWLLALVRPLEDLAPLPPLGRLSQGGDGFGQGVGAGPGGGGDLLPGSAAAGAAGGLAGSLADHGAGREIAEALARGDPAQAAAAARRLADRADQLSPAGRRSLSEALRQAARELSDDAQPGLRQALEAAASSLEGSGTDIDPAGLERMADQLARLSALPLATAALRQTALIRGDSGTEGTGATGPDRAADQARPAAVATPLMTGLAAPAIPAMPLLIPRSTVQPVFDQAEFSPGPWSDAGSWESLP